MLKKLFKLAISNKFKLVLRNNDRDIGRILSRDLKVKWLVWLLSLNGHTSSHFDIIHLKLSTHAYFTVLSHSMWLKYENSKNRFSRRYHFGSQVKLLTLLLVTTVLEEKSPVDVRKFRYWLCRAS